MNRINLRVVAPVVLLAVCIACVVIFLLGSQLGIHQFVGDNPATAQKIASSLLDYRQPAGFIEQGGRDIGILKMVVIADDWQESQYLAGNMILLTSYPTLLGLSEDQFRQELRLAILRSSADISTMEFVREETATIRGQEVKLAVYESFGEYDRPTRIVVSSGFPGKQGQVILLFAGPIAQWDQKMIDRFMASIR